MAIPEVKSMFTDRQEAGLALAQKLLRFRGDRPIVLALPRGGLPVALEIARSLRAPLGLVLVRKIGAPGQPELAIGAVADGPDSVLVTDRRLVTVFGVDDAWLEKARDEALGEIVRRRTTYLAGRPDISAKDRVVIVVDDGIATGSTMRAALRSLRHQGAKKLILAAPVAAPHALDELESEADETVCLEQPANFMAVGQFYRRFPQLEDQEVIDHLNEAAAFVREPPA